MLYLIRFCLIAITLVTLSTSALKASVQKEMQQKYKSLVDSKDAFISSGLLMTEAEHESLRHLKIDKFDEYDNFGDSDQLKEQIKDFLHNLGSQDDETTQVIANLITRLNKAVIRASQKEIS
ncbi:MAG: hypothetical protein ACRYGR_03900 [Janthinobacterium lividum]